jgi:hypothetical protein
MKMSGLKLRETLENDLGFEADRARELPILATSQEISVYWANKALPAIAHEDFTAMAKAGLLAGVAGLQKIEALIGRLVQEIPDHMTISEITSDISALAAKHQTTLNLSRHRTTCVNAHLNVLDPEKLITRIYGSYVSESDLTNYKNRGQELLNIEISSPEELGKWVSAVHVLLNDLSQFAQSDSKGLEQDSQAERGKGLINQKAMPTYFKQWELFVKEKIGPFYGVVVVEADASPLHAKLQELEADEYRSFTTIINDITEIRSNTSFQKRLYTQTKTVNAAQAALLTHQFQLKERPCIIQRSSTGFSAELIYEFVKAMKAQLFVYSGKGKFEASLSTGSSLITVSLPNATKSDIATIENYLLLLI